MNEVAQYFERAWKELIDNYLRTIESFDTEDHVFPYGVYWKEVEIVSELVSLLKKNLPKQYEVHLDVTFNPQDWEILEKHKRLIKRKGNKWPQIDILILDALAREGRIEEKPFSLLAEVKYSEPKKTFRSRHDKTSEEGIRSDVRRLKKYRKDICNSAFFCYFDEYHTQKSFWDSIKKLCGKSVRFLNFPEVLKLKKTEDDIVIREESIS
jgi:hypothetical protein